MTMNCKTLILLAVGLFFQTIGTTQVNYNANDVVPEYNDYFRPGVNPGSYQSWTDEQLADLAAGNPYLNIPGIGAKTIRPSLPEFFLDTYGYDVRLGAFQYFTELGMDQNVCFIGYPNLRHRDTTTYCEGASIGQLFANMYTPVWDGGLNGTPYNDDNYLAAYMYKTVTMYKDYVRFWEIWNEPSLDASNYRATLPKGHPESWWDNDPDPCDLDIQAPVYHYIRMLRVCYDVIKTVDPDAFVTLGGVGYYSFFDVLCRNTDNPVDGSVTPEYPLAGGAYFDAVGIHTYPHFDGSTIFQGPGGLVYERHSDAAADGIVIAKNGREEVLAEYGYDGVTYPKKEMIITEINIPRLPFQNFMGSALSQRNFMAKALVTSMSNGIDQLHIYNLGDIEEESTADSWFDVMGLYGNLTATPPYNQDRNESGLAYKTASDMLYQTVWDSTRSSNLNLPPTMRGGALRRPNGDYVYVLWAKTYIDQSEDASETYSFPAGFGLTTVYKKEWDYNETLFEEAISSQNIVFNSTPTFFTATPDDLPTEDFDVSDCPETFDGFNYMGQFLGSKYFLSNSQLTWQDAKAFCEEKGGNLVEVNGFAENNFIKNNISDPVFIGLSDDAVEGTFAWTNGEPVVFNNIDECAICQPNTESNDYLMLHSWDGKWSYNPEFVAKYFVMEFDCFNDTIPTPDLGGGGSDCDAPITGFTEIGELGGKQYYISNGANDWEDARFLAQAQGGDLVVIDDAVENLFIQGKINEMVHIGLSDQAVEGNLVWVDGSPLDYENFDLCNFCGSNNSDRDNLVMHPWNGGWSFATTSQNFRSIMERTCEPDTTGTGGGGGTGGNCDTNLALNASATQSGTQLNASASRAVDGNTDGNFWGQNSTTLTNWIAQPWLEIDLGEVYDIENIELWNRDDCCTNLFANYHILVSNTPFTNATLAGAQTQTGVSDFPQTGEAARPTTQNVNRSGRYIRVQLEGTSFLAITEIKVIGCETGGGTNCEVAGTPCDDNDPTTLDDVEDGNCGCAGTPDTGGSGCTTVTNLALNKPTNQSSTLTAGQVTGISDKAVDGNTNGTYFISPASSSSVSATNNEYQAFWEVDLEAAFLIEKINLYNRTDGVDKTENAYVLISDTPFTGSDLASARAQATYEYFVNGLVGSPSEIYPNVSGQYIRVQRDGVGYLLIAELEAMGCVAPTQNFVVPHLLNFNATKNGQLAEVDWLISKDENVETYEVEFSTDETSFSLLETLEARSLDAAHQYQTVHQKPEQGANFYRLKVIQKDGTFYHTAPRQVVFEKEFAEVHLFPNPTNELVYLGLRTFAGNSGTVEIYNSIGQKMMSQDFEKFAIEATAFDVSEFPQGMYSVVVQVKGMRSFTKKFVVGK